MDDKDIDISSISIDVGSEHIGSSNSIDTITLDTGWDSIGSMNMATYSYTIPTSTATSSYTISNGTWNTTTPYVSANTNITPASISVEGDAEFNGSIKVKGKDLGEWMETLERRLAILVPDPKKLEQYEALQKAYKHYKMLEALCEERKDDDTEK